MNTRLDETIQRLALAVPVANRIRRDDLEDLIRALEVIHYERPHPDHLWSPYRVALYLGLDVEKTRRMLKGPGGPAPIIGEAGLRLYRARDIFAWLDGKTNPRENVVELRAVQ